MAGCACLLIVGSTLNPMAPAAAGQIEIVDGIGVTEHAESATVARAQAFERALRIGIEEAWSRHRPGRPLRPMSADTVEAAIAFVDVLGESLSSTSYRGRFAVGVDLEVLADLTGISLAIMPKDREAPASPAVSAAPNETFLVPLGAPGALDGYRRRIQASDARWISLAPSADGSISIKVGPGRESGNPPD